MVSSWQQLAILATVPATGLTATIRSSNIHSRERAAEGGTQNRTEEGWLMRPLSDHRSLPPTRNINPTQKKRKPQKKEARGSLSPRLPATCEPAQVAIIAQTARTLDLTVGDLPW